MGKPVAKGGKDKKVKQEAVKAETKKKVCRERFCRRVAEPQQLPPLFETHQLSNQPGPRF